MNQTKPCSVSGLRSRAEKLLKEKQIKHNEGLAEQVPDPLRLIHELQVHQIELEMQNEELRRVQAQLLAQKQHVQDLYDQAPVGYLSLSGQDLILDANNTAHTLLGMNRRELLQQPFTRFILPEDQDLFCLFRKRLQETNTPADVDLRLLRADGSSVWVCLQVNGIQADGNDVTPSFRVAITDISDKKQIEETLQFLAHHLSGESFFTGLTQYLAQALRIDFVCINMLEGDGLSARTLAASSHGAFRDHLRYALQDSPCGQLGREVCCFPAGVCRLFPGNDLLKELQAESYAGVTLWSSSGQAIGLIAVIGCRPLANPTQAKAVLRLVAVRAAGELERLIMSNDLMVSEQRYALTCSAVSDGLWEWHVPSGEVDCTPHVYRILGYDDKELPADYATWRTLIHPQDIDRVEQKLRQKVEQGKRFVADLRMRQKSGEWLWVNIRGRVVEQDRAGKALRMSGTLTDITNRKEIEQALQKQNETYRDILATTHDGFWLVDFQGNILDVNDSYCRQSGYSRQEPLTMHPFDLDSDESSSQCLDRIRQLTEVGQGVFERVHRRKDGSTWHVEVSVGVSNKAGGQFVTFLRDITERKRTEDTSPVRCRRRRRWCRSSGTGSRSIYG